MGRFEGCISVLTLKKLLYMIGDYEFQFFKGKRSTTTRG